MNAPAFEVGTKVSRSTLGLRQRGGTIHRRDVARLVDHETGECECLIEKGTHWFKASGISAVPSRLHRLTNELENMRSILLCILALRESVIYPNSLGHRAWINHPA